MLRGKNIGFGKYLKKRFWRIYPELWLGVTIEIIAIVIFYVDKIDWMKLIIFIFTQGTILQFWTPEFLRGYGCGTPNGSLWTMCILIQFYIIIWFIYKLLHKRKIWIWLISLGILVTISAFFNIFFKELLPEIIYKLYKQTVIPYLWLFIMGAFIAENKEKILPILKKYWYVFLGIALVVQIIQIDILASYGVIRSFSLFFGLLGVAYKFPKFNISKDISYGIYIYHMTIVNILISIGFMENLGALLLTIIFSCILAWISHKTVGTLSISQRDRLERGRI